MSDTQAYVGNELDLFAHARNWKGYLARRLAPHLRGAVLEVGAGKGTNTALLSGAGTSWTCLEPDPSLAGEITARGLRCVSGPVSVRAGTTASLAAEERFDCVLYLDVLEHIEDDRAELARSFSHLAPGGRLVVMSPAHQFLFSPFDKSVGHFRRYSRKELAAVGPPGARLLELRYLDSVGFFASFANSLLLQQKMPTLSQIRFWDGVLVPASRVVDPLSFFRFGKSVLGTWEKP